MKEEKQATFDCKEFVIELGSNGKKKNTHRLNHPTVSQLTKFEKMKGAPTTIKRNGEIISESNENEAFVLLYDELAVPDKEKTDKKWLDQIPVMQKIAAVKHMFSNFLVTEEHVQEEYGEEFLVQDHDGPVVYLEVLNGNKLHLTAHLLKEPTLEQLNKWDRIGLKNKTKTKKGKITITPCPTVARDRCALYDDLIVETKYYGEGDIPPIHKMEVVGDLFAALNEDIGDIVKN